MTKIKLCGLRRMCDIEAANELRPDYIGFVFAKRSKRHVTSAEAKRLKEALHPEIKAVGVFVDEAPEKVAALLREGVIDLAQLHGTEDAAYLARLRGLTDASLLQAFRIAAKEDIARAEKSGADHVLLDAGEGSGETFHWALAKGMTRPFFLAGGLSPENVAEAVKMLRPFAVDVSSGIETDGAKDREKMAAFVRAVRKDGAG